ncbi:DUF4192 domain-containing protein [Streptomyces sp. NPDC089919]|uniref:DUF4192 domain-containing protein n=1 Tax=Streptomyces sp. NPDC089919 TaxID=3155188 RepID=UPI0034413494
MTNSSGSPGPRSHQQITLRSPAELADALPYMLGYHPDDSIVMVAVHGSGGRFGGRLRVGIPPAPEEWEELAGQLAETLVRCSERRSGRPDGIVVYLCQDPPAGGPPGPVMRRLRPLAQQLRVACGALDVPVLEALCLSGGRYHSYCCPDARCCPPEGTPLAMPGSSVMAAAATYAGLRVRGSLKALEAPLTPVTGPAADAQVLALDRAAAALVPRILEGTSRAQVAGETLALARGVMRRLARATPEDGGPSSDAWDDALLSDTEAATLILGLQDRETRDVAAEWMEGAEAGPALRLWRALSRRCAGEYAEHAAAPLTLAGWVTWSLGDEPYARIAFGLALRADPGYRFALLLHQACNESLDPENLRRCLREERRRRELAEARRPLKRPPGLAAEPEPERPPAAEAVPVTAGVLEHPAEGSAESAAAEEAAAEAWAEALAAVVGVNDPDEGEPWPDWGGPGAGGSTGRAASASAGGAEGPGGAVPGAGPAAGASPGGVPGPCGPAAGRGARPRDPGRRPPGSAGGPRAPRVGVPPRRGGPRGTTTSGRGGLRSGTTARPGGPGAGGPAGAGGPGRDAAGGRSGARGGGPAGPGGARGGRRTGKRAPGSAE